MRNFIIYLTGFLCLFLTSVFSQETFESRAKSIAIKIENITKEEKEGLKSDIEAVNIELEKGMITKNQADEKKIHLANSRAKAIEFRVAQAQNELKDLVQDKVDGKIKEEDPSKTIVIHLDDKVCPRKKDKAEKRTTSQFVLAFGANNLVTNGAVANSDFYYWQSHFFEWGFTNNTRILKDDNLLHFKYGFSVMYNNLCPTENRYFVPVGNNQTNLEVFPKELQDSRFKNVYLVAPLHLEFDFSDNKSEYGTNNFSTHKGVRFGIGGYGGFRIKSKQKLYYNEDDDKIRIKTKGNFNVNDFMYGLSTYLGYKATSLYLKYDLSPLFENNTVDQNNISLGLRFDFN